MKNKIFKNLLIFTLVSWLTIGFLPVKAATTFSISPSTSEVKPNESFVVNVQSNGEGRIEATASNGRITSVSTGWYPDVKSFTVKAGGSGKVTVTVKAVTVSDGIDELTNVSKSISVTVKEVQVNKPNPPSTPPVTTPEDKNKETEAERKAREEREAAAKAQAEKEAAEKELENKKKTPLVGEISILSESDRLKGKEVVKLETEFENFKYSAKLPRSVDAFKLDLKPIADDVTLTYDAMYKLDEGHDKVEITVKAVQGEIEQTFNLTVNRHVESKVTLTQEDKNYSLLVDDLIDGKMKELGVTRNLFNKEKDDTFYYYEYEGVKFALVYDADKVARWVIMDDKGAFVEEVILIIDQNKKPRFIVDVPLDEDIPTLNGNRYEQTNLTLPKEILALDESMNFNDQVSAWVYDETGFITHEYVPVENKDVATTDDSFVDVDQDSPYQLVYVGNDASVQTAFVAFDGVNNNMTTLVYVLSGLLVALALAFIIYWRMTSKKVKMLLTRR